MCFHINYGALRAQHQYPSGFSDATQYRLPFGQVAQGQPPFPQGHKHTSQPSSRPNYATDISSSGPQIPPYSDTVNDKENADGYMLHRLRSADWSSDVDGRPSRRRNADPRQGSVSHVARNGADTFRVLDGLNQSVYGTADTSSSVSVDSQDRPDGTGLRQSSSLVLNWEDAGPQEFKRRREARLKHIKAAETLAQQSSDDDMEVPASESDMSEGEGSESYESEEFESEERDSDYEDPTYSARPSRIPRARHSTGSAPARRRRSARTAKTDLPSKEPARSPSSGTSNTTMNRPNGNTRQQERRMQSARCICPWTGCSEPFGRYADMKRHLKGHFMTGSECVCKACGQTCARRDALARHCKKCTRGPHLSCYDEEEEAASERTLQAFCGETFDDFKKRYPHCVL